MYYKFTKQAVYLYLHTNLCLKKKSLKGYSLDVNRHFVKWQDWVWLVFAISLCFLLLSNFSLIACNVIIYHFL